MDKQPTKFVDVEGIADTGAQCSIWCLDQFLKAGFAMSYLSPTVLSLNAANKLPICIDGVFFANITRTPSTKSAPPCHSMVYINRDIKALYLSYNSMLQLGIINRDFPTVGKFQQELDNKRSKDPKKSTETLAGPSPVASTCDVTRGKGGVFECPRKAAAPVCPKELPLP